MGRFFIPHACGGGGGWDGGCGGGWRWGNLHKNMRSQYLIDPIINRADCVDVDGVLSERQFLVF